jgi:hypothetical protein
MTFADDERLIVAVRGGAVVLVNGKPARLPCRISSRDTIATVPRKEWEQAHGKDAA